LTKTETLIVIPARGGSKRLPGKNIKLLQGRSLLEWTDQAIRDAKLNAPCLLTTDCQDIANAGLELGWTVPFLRPNDLASDTASTFDTVIHTLDWWREQSGSDPEYVMLLQVTSPLRGADVLQKGIAMLKGNPDAQAVVGAQHIKCAALFQTTPGGYISALDLDEPSAEAVVPNGALYVIRTETLREEATFFPRNTLPLFMGDAQSIDIDTEFDWAIAEMITRETTAEGTQKP